MYYIKRIASGCFTIILAANLLTGCSLRTNKTPENTTQTMPTVTKEVPATSPAQTTTAKETEEETQAPASSTEANTIVSPITEFLQQQDAAFTTITDYMKTSEGSYLILYSTSTEDSDANTYRLVLANPEANTYEVILKDTPLIYLKSMEDESSFTIVKLYQKSTDTIHFIPIAPQLIHFYRSDSSFLEETIPYIIDKNDSLFKTYSFGDNTFDSAAITDLILENNTLRIRQQIHTTSSEPFPVLTLVTYDAEENKFVLSMECHDNVEILPQPEENSLIKTIFLSKAEEGSTLEISPSSNWDGQYYIQTELISQDDTAYTIDTLFSLEIFIPIEDSTEMTAEETTP